MKVKVLREVEVDVTTINVRAHVRYWEDGKINGVRDNDLCDNPELAPNMPCARKIEDDWYWCPKIDVETGKIYNWTQGVEAEIHYKVCDEFSCVVQDYDCAIIKEYEGYVPSFMCPKEEGYGDYIIMDINEDGFIEDWNKWDVVDFLTRTEEDY